MAVFNRVSAGSLAAAFSLWLLLAALAVSSELIRHMSSAGVALFVLFWAIPLSALLFWRHRLRRRAILQVYITPDSWLQSWYRGGLILLLGQFLIALALSFIVLAGLIQRSGLVFWPLLVAFVPLWVMSYHGVGRVTGQHISPTYRPLITQRVHGLIMGIILLSVFSVWALFQPTGDLSGTSIEAAVLLFTQDNVARSGVLQGMLDAMAAIDALRHWLAQNLAGEVPSTGLRLLVWLLVLAQEWLVVWPLVLLLQAIHRGALFWADRAHRMPVPDDGSHTV